MLVTGVPADAREQAFTWANIGPDLCLYSVTSLDHGGNDILHRRIKCLCVPPYHVRLQTSRILYHTHFAKIPSDASIKLENITVNTAVQDN